MPARRSILWLLLSCLPIVFYFGVVAFYAINVPFYDDYQTLLESTLKLNKTDGFLEKLNIIFGLHNEHRLGFVRTLGWLQYVIFGQINFKILQLIGNFSFLIFFIFLVKNINKAVFWPIIALILFQFQSWDNAFWAMASLQNFWVYVWVLASLYCLLNVKKYNFILAVFFAFIATFTSGNGLFVFAIGFLILAEKLIQNHYFSNEKNKASILKLVTWLLIGGCIIGFYLIGVAENHPSQPNTNYPRTILNLAQFFFAFVGSNFWVPTSKYISIAFGAGLSLSFVAFVALGYYRKNPFVLSFLAFMLLSAVVVAWNRYLIGVDVPLSSRYRISGTLITALVAIGWLELASEKALKFLLPLAFIGALGFNFVSNFMYFDRLKELKNTRLLETYLAKTQNRITGHYKPEEAFGILTKAKAAGVFSMPEIEPSIFISQPVKAFSIKAQNIDYQIDTVIVNKNFKTIEGWASYPSKKDNLSQIYLLLEAPNQPVIYLKTIPIKRYDLVRFKAKPLSYIESGFMAFLPDSLLGANDYKIGIAIKPKIGDAGYTQTGVSVSAKPVTH